MEKNNDEITIINPLPDEGSNDEWRGPGEFFRAAKVTKNVLARNAKIFSNNISSIFKNVESTLDEFELDEIQVLVGLSTSGKFMLLGSGLDIKGEGSMKLVFKRQKSETAEEEVS